MICYKCNYEINSDIKIRRQETCPKCSGYLHCCRNCRFYDPAAYHECHEPQAEWVRDKEMANFCEYFEPRKNNGSQGNSKADEAKKKLEELFKKK
jgi:hypothetical protein